MVAHTTIFGLIIFDKEIKKNYRELIELHGF